MKREIIKIDEEKCNGCGICIPACPEGALQIIDDKARLVSDLMCDGLGACIGECPEGAIEIEEREAEPYNETTVIKEIIKHGENTVVAHLKHLKDHGETAFMREALDYLEGNESSLEFSLSTVKEQVHNEAFVAGDGCVTEGCPGARTMTFDIDNEKVEEVVMEESVQPVVEQKSTLRQWPVQMHLLNPMAPYFHNADVVLGADCVAFSLGDFHQKYLKDHSLAIACPKLDQGKEIYIEKLKTMIDNANINTLTVMVMEVPCCSGLTHLAQLAREQASRNVPIKKIVVSIKGEILHEDWV